MKSRALPMLIFAAFCAAMLGLAAGAIWMVVTLYFRHPVPWMALPVGALLAMVIRLSVRRPGSGAALLAALATGLAAIYLNLLIAGILIAGSMGMGLIDALRKAGLGMLWQLAQMAAHPADVLWTLLGMLLAAALAWVRRAR